MTTVSPTTNHDTATAEQYGERADAYVTSAVHAAGADLDQIAAFAAQAPVQRALDLGCGGGHVAYRLAVHADAVDAVDLSPPMLAAVARTAASRGLRNIAVHAAGAERLPFTDGTFDFVASRFSVHHWQDAAAGLMQARRVARPGARAIFTDVMAPVSALLDTHLQTVELLRDGTHVRDYNLTQWLAMLGQARFAVTAVTPRRLRMDFATWIERTQASNAMAQAIRAVQRASAREVQEAFEIEADGSFSFDTVTIEARAV